MSHHPTCMHDQSIIYNLVDLILNSSAAVEHSKVRLCVFSTGASSQSQAWAAGLVTGLLLMIQGSAAAIWPVSRQTSLRNGEPQLWWGGLLGGLA